MSNNNVNRPWDFSSVFELNNALASTSITDTTNTHKATEQGNDQPSITTPLSKANDAAQSISSVTAKTVASLGDFNKIWQYLGVPAPPDHAKTNGSKPNLEIHFQSKADYTSDGAVRYGQRATSAKNVRWTDETSADEPMPNSGSEQSPDREQKAEKLTKNQRKKRNRKARQLAGALGAHAIALPGTVSESEADNIIARTPAHRASTHQNHDVFQQNSQRQLNSLRPTLATKSHSNGASELAINQNHQPKPSEFSQSSNRLSAVAQSSDTPQNIRRSSQPTTNGSSDGPFATPTRNPQNLPQWPAATITDTGSMKFLPSTVSPKHNTTKKESQVHPIFSDAATQAAEAVHAASRNLNDVPTPTRSDRTLIAPKIVRSGEDRHWALFLKLLEEFSEDRKYMVAPMNMTTHNNDAAGIHIFVDASNIFIGFHDQLKLARQIPLKARVPQVHLSFDALALLMERRRPVAKRVLVGSTPHLPAFDKAKAVGYECNVLEKVYKARELTDRQIYFRDIDHQTYTGSASRSAMRHAATAYSGPESGSETTASAPQYASARNVEQGVDEILHLKILESIVDSETPSTMVLATGDAAQAEYSGGFMAMAERALKKGWKVELVSWSKNISSMYLRPRFRDLWKDNFRVIFLDDYAEELLDM